MLKQATRKPSLPRAIATPATAAGDAASGSPPARWLSLTLGLGLAGSLLLWAAFPPVGWHWLAWIAPVPWLWLARQPKLAGRRPYLMLWLAGSLHWLAMLYGVRMAHPALNAGWVVLSA